MSLYEIHHDNRSNLWCGPAVIAAITGQPTSVITRIAREVTGRTMIASLSTRGLIGVMARLGYRIVASASFVKSEQPTLAAFIKDKRALFAKHPMIVNVTHHYVVLHGRRFVDNATRDPVALADAPRRRARVQHVWSFERVGKAQLPAAPAKKTSSGDMAKAKRLAAKHGITIEREFNDLWFVYCPALDDNDPHDGDHYCNDGEEVLERVQDYIKHLV